ncbi:MAG: ParB/RepB/Spo0J family partition protein [Alphaproteobacteria bacterium]
MGDSAAIRAVGGVTAPSQTVGQGKGAGEARASSGVTTIAIERISSGLYQPRAVFDEDSLNDLAESIRQHGIVQPLLVRPKSGGKGENYELIAGERRWRAAQKAKLHDVPVVIRDADDQMAAEIAMIENIQRRDLSVIEEAEGYRRLITEFEYTQDALSKVIGKSRSHLANTMRLLNLPEEVKAHVKNGFLTAGQVRPLIGRDDAAQLAAQILSRGMSARQVEALVTAQDRPPRPKPEKSADVIALEQDLAASTGLEVTVTDKGEAGIITIKYSDLEQFDEIVKRLKS